MSDERPIKPAPVCHNTGNMAIDMDNDCKPVNKKRPLMDTDDDNVDMKDKISDTSRMNQEPDDFSYPYDVQAELRRLSAVPKLEIQTQAVERGKELAKILETVARKTESGSPDFFESLRSAINFQLATKRFGVIGDVGQGKSKTINSMLNVEEVAATGDTGFAETQMPTEFCQKEERHTAVLTAEAIPYSAYELFEDCKDLLKDVRRPLFLDTEDDTQASDDGEEPGSDLDSTSAEQGEFSHLKVESVEAASVGWSRLSALFQDQDSFDRELLDDLSEGAEAKILRQMKGWLRELDWPADAAWTVTADTPGRLHRDVRRRMKDRFWPFVKVVRVFMDNPLLKSGVILVDLPGVQDTNRSRGKMAEAYLHNCHVIFILANIGRVLDNLRLKQDLDRMMPGNILAEADTPGKYIRTAVITTKTHTINTDSGRRSLQDTGDERKNEMLDGLDNRIFELESFIRQNKGNVPRNRANILGKRTRSSKNQAELSQKCKELVAEMDDLFEEVLSHAKGTNLPGDFSRDIELSLGSLKGAFDLLKEKLLHKLWKLRRHSSGSTEATSHMLDAMTEAYQEASQVTGTGMSAIQKGIIAGVVEPGKPFKDNLSRIQTGFTAVNEDFHAKLFTKATQELNSIWSGLDTLDDTPIKADEARLENLEQAREEAKRLQMMLEEAVKAADFANLEPDTVVIS